MAETTGKKIAVIRCGALGDVLLLLPFLNAVRKTRPASLDLIVDSRFTGLLSRFSCVDRAFSQDHVQLWRIYKPEGADTADAFFPERYDLTLAFLNDTGETVASNLRRMSRGDAVVRSPFPKTTDNQCHVSEFYLRASGWDLSAKDLSNPQYRPDAESLDFARGFVGSGSGDFWAIHPGSGSERKNWPLFCFLKTGIWLKKKGFRLLLLLGPAEEERADEIISAFLPLEPVVARNIALEKLAATLSLCRGYIGNDSGTTHLAAFVGIPTAGVFCATDPAQWGPRGERARAVLIKKPQGPLAAGNGWAEETPGACRDSGIDETIRILAGLVND